MGSDKICRGGEGLASLGVALARASPIARTLHSSAPSGYNTQWTSSDANITTPTALLGLQGRHSAKRWASSSPPGIALAPYCSHAAIVSAVGLQEPMDAQRRQYHAIALVGFERRRFAKRCASATIT